jgi:hypothetical protein
MAEAMMTATKVAACQKLRSAGTVAQDCAEKLTNYCQLPLESSFGWQLMQEV